MLEQEKIREKTKLPEDLDGSPADGIFVAESGEELEKICKWS